MLFLLLLLCLGEKISVAIELIDGALVVWVRAAPEEHTYSLRSHRSRSRVRREGVFISRGRFSSSGFRVGRTPKGQKMLRAFGQWRAFPRGFFQGCSGGEYEAWSRSVCSLQKKRFEQVELPSQRLKQRHTTLPRPPVATVCKSCDSVVKWGPCLQLCTHGNSSFQKKWILPFSSFPELCCISLFCLTQGWSSDSVWKLQVRARKRPRAGTVSNKWCCEL